MPQKISSVFSEYSFPSKLPRYLSYGKLVVSSAIKPVIESPLEASWFHIIQMTQMSWLRLSLKQSTLSIQENFVDAKIKFSMKYES